MVLVLSSMYSSNNNLTESSDLLNISGKRYNRNTSKTIWSYNPDDATTKKLNSKWRPNSSSQKQTNGLLTGSFTTSQISDTSMPSKSNLKPKLTKYFDDNESSLFSIPQSKVSPRQSASNSRPSSSASSRSSGKKATLKANIVSTVVLPPDNMNKLIEFNTSASRRIREKMLEQEEKEDQKLQRSLSNKIDKQLLFREVTVVRPDSSMTERSNTTLKKMIDNFNNEQAPIICGKHIDNLTTEIFVALSNGIDKSTLLRRSATSISQSAKEKSTTSSFRTSSLNLNEFYEIDENERTEDNFVLKICNEIKNYKPEFKEDSASKGDAALNKAKSVKIVEPNEETDVKIKRSSKNLVPSDFSQMERLMKGLPIEEKDHFDYGEKLPASYFDPYFDENDFSFKYKRVLNDQFEQIIDQYDGSSPVELTLKQSLPLNEYYVTLTSSSPQTSRNEKKNDNDTKKNRPKSAKSEMNPEYEMYNILKRMMVKKKYEVATIKLEEKNSNKTENDKRKRRCQSSVAPVYSSPTLTNINNINQPIKIKTRPNSSLSLNASSINFNGIPSTNSLLSKPFAEDDDDEEDENLENKIEDYSIGDPIIRCVKCKKKFVPKSSGRQTPSTLSDKYDLYDEFKISNDAIKIETWPYELDTNKVIENGNNKKHKKKSESKCYSCKNVPAVIKIPSFDSNLELEQSKPKNEEIFRIHIQRSKTSLGNKKEKSSLDQQQYQSQTYTSARRTASAKYLNLNNQELTDNVDKDEFNRLKCSHPKQMTSRELSQYQRKISMIPGKTFSSQRRQSISINRPPLSKIKFDYEKENKISKTFPLVKLSNSPSAVLNNKNNIPQRPQKQLQSKKQNQQQEKNLQEQYQEEQVQQEQQEKVELEQTETKIVKEDSISKFSSDSVIEKYRENKKSKKFNIDLFSPSSTAVSKIKLFHNEHLDQMNDPKEISAISAFHIYRKASRLINKRPKTAK